MKIEQKSVPRRYLCGLNSDVEIQDCGSVYLDANQQLTFKTESKKEHDVCAKSWGYYATASINGRLKEQGFKTALVENSIGRIYVLLVESERMQEFESYLASENARVIEWLDERAVKP